MVNIFFYFLVFCMFKVTKMLNMNELERMKLLFSARKLKEREEITIPLAIGLN